MVTDGIIVSVLFLIFNLIISPVKSSLGAFQQVVQSIPTISLTRIQKTFSRLTMQSVMNIFLVSKAFTKYQLIDVFCS